MDEFSGNRAKPGRRPPQVLRGGRRAAAVALLAIVPLAPALAAGGGGHGSEPAAAAGPPPPGPPRPKPAYAPPPKLEAVVVAPRLPRMTADPRTGIAIGGIDPVSYFVEPEPREGAPRFELEWRGATWRFLNEGNLMAFRADPEVYAPRFSGLCVFQLAAGLIAEAEPGHWVIHRDRLYLFATAAHRVGFLSDPDAMVASAEANWPDIAGELP
ncbi:YHS domain-containing (seleno)protein [Prosthecomicrobium sp. N25]|uniref:YHS domain-containing (seleno)protein n=1 Tax=Prosthecomicrobium sp. N25 TaxID=3129254 RepID=UPI003078497E